MSDDSGSGYGDVWAQVCVVVSEGGRVPGLGGARRCGGARCCRRRRSGGFEIGAEYPEFGLSPSREAMANEGALFVRVFIASFTLQFLSHVTFSDLSVHHDRVSVRRA